MMLTSVQSSLLTPIKTPCVYVIRYSLQTNAPLHDLFVCAGKAIPILAQTVVATYTVLLQ